jgi:threonine aldolase
MNFASDNVTGAAPDILQAIVDANEGNLPSYGADPLTARMQQRLCQMFERDVAVFPVATGTAANALALSVLSPPWGTVFCHADSHIYTDECGAPELMTQGARLQPLPGPHGKLTPEVLAAALAEAPVGFVHGMQPAALSLTQATEAGTCYTVAEVAALTALARQHRLRVHMDGARFANAIAHLGCSPADVTWKAGVDILSLGATKNGALCAEAVIFFDPALAVDFGYRRKRAAQLFSKMRFVSAQFDAWLTDDRWLTLARHANAMAARLAAGLQALPGLRLRDPVEANELFLRMPDQVTDGLLAAGFQFYRWEGDVVRMVTAWNTSASDVDHLIQAAAELTKIT